MKKFILRQLYKIPYCRGWVRKQVDISPYLDALEHPEIMNELLNILNEDNFPINLLTKRKKS